MVSKLSFKGERKKAKKKNVHVRKHKDHEDGNDTLESFAINGKELKIDDIDLSAITSGWTTAYPIDFQVAGTSILDAESSKLPVIIAYGDSSKALCLKSCKYTSTEEPTIKNKVVLSGDVELSSTENTVIYTSTNVLLEDKLNRIEPSEVSQVFILSDVSSIFSSANKVIGCRQSDTKGIAMKSLFSLKSTDGEYLTFDPSSNELKFSMTLTENGLYTLDFETNEPIMKCRITVGKTDERNTLMVTKNGDLKVIPDPDDLLGSLSRFVIRLRKQDAYQTKKILRAAKDKEVSSKSPVSGIDGKVGTTVVELSKLGFKINDKTLKEISKAHTEGRINQWILDFKEKNVHDRMA